MKMLVSILVVIALSIKALSVSAQSVYPHLNNDAGQEKNTLKLNFSAAANYSAQHKGLGVVVAINGEIVFEEYHKSYTADFCSYIHSGTKGFWGPVTALMIQEGLLQGYDQKVSDILTEWKNIPVKQNITIRQLMELSSGLVNNLQKIEGHNPEEPDLYTYAAHNASFATKPGERFQYGPVNFYVMGAVMNRVLANAGSAYTNPLEYLEAKLFLPLGIQYEKWVFDKAGNPHLPNGACLTPRNWIKWGQFVLQKGEWEGKQLIRRDLMEALFVPSCANLGYGLFMWLNTRDGFGIVQEMRAPSGSAAGFMYYDGYPDIIGILGAGPNRMYMIPSLNMVIVRQTPQIEISRKRFIDHEFLKQLFN